MDRPLGVTILAVLHFIAAAALLLLAVLFMLGMDLALTATDRGLEVWIIAMALMGLGGAMGFGEAAVVILLIFAAIPLILGIGLWQLKNWARIVTILLTGLGVLTWLLGRVGSVLVGLPMEFDPLSLIGLGISPWILWYLSRPQVTGAFRARPRTPGFYMERRSSALINALRPTWLKVGVSLLAAPILGGGGVFLYLLKYLLERRSRLRGLFASQNFFCLRIVFADLSHAADLFWISRKRF